MRLVATLSMIVGWVLALGFLGVAYAGQPEAAETMTLTMGAGGPVLSVNAGDITFPAAVVYGFMRLSTSTMTALREWTPTVHLVHLEQREPVDE